MTKGQKGEPIRFAFFISFFSQQKEPRPGPLSKERARQGSAVVAHASGRQLDATVAELGLGHGARRSEGLTATVADAVRPVDVGHLELRVLELRVVGAELGGTVLVDRVDDQDRRLTASLVGAGAAAKVSDGLVVEAGPGSELLARHVVESEKVAERPQVSGSYFSFFSRREHATTSIC